MRKTRGKADVLDGFLVASARVGDRRAFALLVERWDSRLRAHAWRLLGDAEQARDAVQEGWGEIVRSLGRLRDEEAFAAWAYRIVSRRCASSIRGAQRSRRLEAAIGAGPASGGPDPPDVGRLRAAVRALPPGQRAAVALFHFEEMSIAETAVALDVPTGTVKTRLMHARRKLRAALEGDEECATSTS